MLEAARACGVSRTTIERLLEQGVFSTAYQESDTKTWRIPVLELELAGMRPRRHLYRRVAAVRIFFGVLFAIDAVLKWLPGFRHGFMGQVSKAASGQAAWIRPWFHFWTHVFSVSPTAFCYLTAVLETVIALALIFGVARQVTYFAAAAYCLGLWVIPEGFGAPYTATNGATDIGVGIIYAVLFLALYQLDTLADESPWSLDPWIERHLPWWRVLSEPSLRVKGGGSGTPVPEK